MVTTVYFTGLGAPVKNVSFALTWGSNLPGHVWWGMEPHHRWNCVPEGEAAMEKKEYAMLGSDVGPCMGCRQLLFAQGVAVHRVVAHGCTGEEN